MEKKYYFFSSRQNGLLTIGYENSRLKSVLMEFKEPLTDLKYGIIFQSIPLTETSNFMLLKTYGFVEKQPTAANQKIALFCEKYEQYKGIKYKATKQDGGKIKERTISPELLDFYFTSSNFLFVGKHSIANLVKYYNELLVDFNNKGKAQHPNEWNAAYATKLTNKELPDYWAHLRSLGLQAKKDRTGNIIDWV